MKGSVTTAVAATIFFTLMFVASIIGILVVMGALFGVAYLVNQ